MPPDHTQGEKDLEARLNSAARRESVALDRERGVTENLENGLSLQAQAVEFAQAFADVRRQRAE